MGNPLLQHGAPALGALLGNCMFFSPLQAVLRVRREGSLGSLNPLPYPVIFGNCTAWVYYALLTSDYYIFFANQPGLMLGLFFSLSTYGLAGPALRAKLERALMLVVLLHTVVGLFIGLVVTDHSAAKSIAGYFSVALLLAYYVAPLSTIVEVLRTGDARSLHLPLSATSLVNGLAWTVYGLYRGDVFIFGPNGFGAIVAGFQLVLIAIYFARRDKEDAEPKGEGGGGLGGAPGEGGAV